MDLRIYDYLKYFANEASSKALTVVGPVRVFWWYDVFVVLFTLIRVGGWCRQIGAQQFIVVGDNVYLYPKRSCVCGRNMGTVTHLQVVSSGIRSILAGGPTCPYFITDTCR